MNRYIVIVILIIISLLSGCGEEKTSDQAAQTNTHTSAKPQEEHAVV